MEKYLFVRFLLDRLAQGKFFYRAIGVTMRVLAALVAILSLTTFFKAGKLTFDLPADGILGGVLFELCLVLAVYAAAHVLVIRARDVEALEVGEFYALRALPLLVRAGGETYACFVSLIGVGGGIFVWFTGRSQDTVLNPFVRALFPSMRDNPSFMTGIEFMLSGVLISIGVLVAAYAVAEAVLLLARLGRSTVPNGNGRHSGEPPSYRSRFGS